MGTHNTTIEEIKAALAKADAPPIFSPLSTDDEILEILSSYLPEKHRWNAIEVLIAAREREAEHIHGADWRIKLNRLSRATCQ